MKELIVYTDGASRGNPGPGGWGAVIIATDVVGEIAGAAPRATNNQMELAAVEGVLSHPSVSSWEGDIVVYSDSTYVINGLTKWLKGWQKNGWMTQAKTLVENKTQWAHLAVLIAPYGSRLHFEKVKGHAGERYNERCDDIAVARALGKDLHLFSGTQKDYDAFIEQDIDSTVTMIKKTKDSRPPYSYVSCINGVVHADKTWAACEKRVKGIKGAKYKKVFSKEEETALIQDYTLTPLL